MQAEAPVIGIRYELKEVLVGMVSHLENNSWYRLGPQVGIALNALHEKAFDRGLITFGIELQLVCASR
jgi:hypothetical protein